MSRCIVSVTLVRNWIFICEMFISVMHGCVVHRLLVSTCKLCLFVNFSISKVGRKLTTILTNCANRFGAEIVQVVVTCNSYPTNKW